jgi:hypothetical protein
MSVGLAASPEDQFGANGAARVRALPHDLFVATLRLSGTHPIQ